MSSFVLLSLSQCALPASIASCVTRRIRLTALCVLLSTLMAPVCADDSLIVSASAKEALQVIDDSQQSVRLPRAARRIISLAPHTTEMVYAAGAGTALVGVVSYSDYPPQAKALPQVGNYTQLDIERIVALRPDLIVAWQSGNPPQQIAALQRLGLPVYLSEPRSIESIASNIERLGLLAGTQRIATREARRVRTQWQQLHQRYSHRPKLRMFYQLWDQPMMTINGEHLISRVMEVCGAENVFAELPLLAAKVDIEAVLKADPQVIVVGGMAARQQQWLRQWRRWPSLKQAHQNLFTADPDLMHRLGPRILLAARQLCEQLESVRTRSGSDLDN